MTSSNTSQWPAPRGTIDRVVVLFALAMLLGPLINSRIGIPGLFHRGGGTNTFFVQYRAHEPIFLGLLVAFLVGVALLVRRQAPDDDSTENAWPLLTGRAGMWLGIGACAVFALTAAGTSAVMHATPLSMDEFVASFQSRMFAAGRITTNVSDDWRRLGGALTPIYVAYDAQQGLWSPQYLPAYAALRAPFVELGLDRFVNPALAAASVLLVHACARRLWPDRPHRAWIAVVFLVSSSQFLFMSMTGYAMPAHLAANLAWLYAYTREDRAGWIAAPLIGVLALGLHNPFPHALFVAPFLVHLLLRRRWAWTAYFASAYLAGIMFWYWVALKVGMGGTTVSDNVFGMPSLLMALVQHLSLTLVFSWQTPIFALALAWTIVRWRSLSPMEKLLVPSVALSFLFFIMFPSTQGHGWGYRYIYATLGNLVLLGAVGTDALAASLGSAFVKRLVVASLVVTAAIQLPIRATQIERYVRPFARAHEYIASRDAEVVIVDPTSSWYGIDLVRNDPFLRNRPKVLNALYLRSNEKRLLADRFGDRVHMLQADTLVHFGIPKFPSRFKSGIWPPPSSTIAGK
jgi:hypothetical protein